MKGKTIIKVQGHLDKNWRERFESLEINYEGANTILSGNVKDDACMHGILNLIKDLNLRLISVNPAEDLHKIT